MGSTPIKLAYVAEAFRQNYAPQIREKMERLEQNREGLWTVLRDALGSGGVIRFHGDASTAKPRL